MPRTVIDIHILQTLPPSNVNRDDTGSPKTAIYGGVRRARVSSQAWKRAVRLAFRQTLDESELGERTKRLGEAIAERIAAFEPQVKDKASELAAKVLKAAGLVKEDKKGNKKTDDKDVEADYLIFLSRRQQDNLARAAIESELSGTQLDSKQLKALVNTNHSIDVAMFGRMVADVSDINVDAAVQVAHALSVHAVDNEFDYYTAIDDRKHDAQEIGAGMIGTVEFNSATYYRYANIDVDRLYETLGSVEAARRAVEAFLNAFVTSMPSGKQNTFANRTRPDAVVVQMRDTQPVNLVGAFEEPIPQDRDGLVRAAAERLASYAREVDEAYGEAPIASWVTHVGERTKALADLGVVQPLPEVVSAVGARVAERLAMSA